MGERGLKKYIGLTDCDHGLRLLVSPGLWVHHQPPVLKSATRSLKDLLARLDGPPDLRRGSHRISDWPGLFPKTGKLHSPIYLNRPIVAPPPQF